MSKINIDKAIELVKKNKTPTPLFDGVFVLCDSNGKPYYIDKTRGGRGLIDSRIFEKVWMGKHTGEKISFVKMSELTKDESVFNCEDDRYIDELVYELRKYYGLESERKLDTFVSSTALKKQLKEVGISVDKLEIRKKSKAMGLKWIICSQLPYLLKDDAQILFNEIFRDKESVE